LQRRVIELDSGVVVRDEAQGGYVLKNPDEEAVAPELPENDLWANPDADWADDVVRGDD